MLVRNIDGLDAMHYCVLYGSGWAWLQLLFVILLQSCSTQSVHLFFRRASGSIGSKCQFMCCHEWNNSISTERLILLWVLVTSTYGVACGISVRCLGGGGVHEAGGGRRGFWAGGGALRADVVTRVRELERCVQLLVSAGRGGGAALWTGSCLFKIKQWLHLVDLNKLFSKIKTVKWITIKIFWADLWFWSFEQSNILVYLVFFTWILLESFSRVISPVVLSIISTHSLLYGLWLPLNTVCGTPAPSVKIKTL